MIPTRRTLWLLAAGIPFAILAAQIGSPWLAVVYNVILLGGAWLSTRLAPDTKGLRLTRKLDPVLSVRAENKIALTLENDGDEEVQGTLRDEAPAPFIASRREFPVKVEPRRQQEMHYTVRPQERGSEVFEGAWLRQVCPFGLAYRDVYLPAEEPVRVYPNLLALREFDLLKQQGRLREIGIRQTRKRGLGMEFESLRDYALGDDYRKIDHKASARRGKLVVRQYETERNQVVILVIDIGRHMLAEVDGVRKLDHVLDAVLMLANAAVVAGDQIGLLVYAENIRRYIPPRKGRNQVGVVIDALHDLIAEPLESDPVAAYAYLASRWKRRSLLVAFTDYEDPERARELLTAFGPLARRHVAVIARVTDPRWHDASVQPVRSVKALYERTAATLLTEDRREAGHIIANAGIHNLEAEPQDLAAKLVTFYMEVKARGWMAG